MADAGAIRAGGAFVEIFTKDGAFQQGMTRVQNRLKVVAAQMKAAGKGMMFVGGGIVAPILAAANAFATLGSEIYDMSQRTGIAAESLSVLRYAAEQTGTDTASLETALKKMQKTIASGAGGSKEAQKALAMLGLTAADLANMTPEQQLGVIADRLMAIKDPAQRTAAAMAIFGKAGTAIIPMLNQGSAGLAAMEARARELGLVMDGQTAEKADRLGDAITDVRLALKMAFIQIGSAVAPILTTIAVSLANAAAAAGKFIQRNQGLINVALKVGAGIFAFGAAVYGIGAALDFGRKTIGVFAQSLQLLGKAFALLATPVGMTVAIVAGGIALMIVAARQLSPAFRRETDAMVKALMRGDFSAAGTLLMANLAVVFKSWWIKIKQVFRSGVDGVAGMFSFMFDKGIEALDRFMELFGGDIMSLSGKLEKLGLIFRAAFDWKWAATSLRGAMAEVDERIARERETNPTASGRAAARDASRSGRATDRDRERDAAAEQDQRELDDLRRKRDDARRAALGEEQKAEEAAANQWKASAGGWADMEDASGGAGGADQGGILSTFASSVAQQLGVGPTMNAQEQTAANTAEIADNTAAMASAMASAPSPEELAPGVAAAGNVAARGAAPSAGGSDLLTAMDKVLLELMKHTPLLSSINKNTANAGLAFG
jgi:hypothetical protein